jgi:hypothetical protein
MDLARDAFYFHADSDVLLGSLNAAIDRVQVARRWAFRAYRHNIAAAIEVAAIPFIVAQNGVITRRWQAILTSELILSRGMYQRDRETKKQFEERRQRIATERAKRKMAGSMRTEREVNAVADAVLSELGSHLARPEFSRSHEELLRQAAASLWTSIEVLVRDSAQMLSKTPQESLSHSLKVLHPMAEDARAVFEPRSLWILCQRRHLILHRRALVDRKYLRATGENLQLGSQLQIAPRWFHQAAKSARDYGVEIADRFC